MEFGFCSISFRPTSRVPFYRLGTKFQESLDALQGQFLGSKPHHAPTGQGRLEVFFKVGSESRRAVVATIDVDAALDLDERAGTNVGKVSPPFSDRMKSKFLLQFRAVQLLPQQFKTLF